MLRPYTIDDACGCRVIRRVGDYLAATSTLAFVVSQDMLRVQPELALSKEMVKFSSGEESLETFISMRARSLLGPG